MPRVVLRGVCKDYSLKVQGKVKNKDIARAVNKGEELIVEAVRDFSVEIEDGEFVVLVGPSGCGKTTLLRLIAGLETITEGELFIDGKPANDLSPKNRNLAMVFQNYALYPHMTVFKNMAFGLVTRWVNKREIKQRVIEAAQVLDIEYLLNRKPKMLSGGQRQRVALGRAMVRNPVAFLLDEPLSNLDIKQRSEIRQEIVKLHKHLNAIFIYVTHDQTEALTLGDRIIVMEAGRIHQIGAPKSLYDHPATIFVAEFIGSPQMNLLPAVIKKASPEPGGGGPGGGAGLGDATEPGSDAGPDDATRPGSGAGDSYYAEFNGFPIAIPCSGFDGGILQQYEGREVILGIRPEYLLPAGKAEPGGCAGIICADVQSIDLLGPKKQVNALCGGIGIVASIPTSSPAVANERIELAFAREGIRLFDKDTGNAVMS